MGFGIAFSPLVPNGILWAALAVAAIAAVLLIVIKSRGALVRAVALAFAALALANPSLTKEDRESLPSVATDWRARAPRTRARPRARARRGS